MKTQNKNENEMNYIMETNLDFAQKCYLSEGGFQTMFVANYTKNKNVTTSLSVLGDEEAVNNRFFIVFNMGVMAGIQLMKKEIDSVESIFTMSEAWISTQGDKDDVKTKKYLLPSEDPNRKEALVSSGMSKDGESVFGVFEIKKSFDENSGKIDVEFDSLEDPGKKAGTKNKNKEDKKDGETKSPLLEEFWKGLELMVNFEKTIPKELIKLMDEATTEEIFSMFSSQLSTLRNEKMLDYKKVII